MKKPLVNLLCAAFILFQYVFCHEISAGNCDETNVFFVEARYSAFFPISNKIRRIYSTALNDVELEIGTTFFKNSRLWFNGGYIFNNGRSLGLHRGTQMQMVPFALGASYTFCNILPCVDAYLGLGGTYTFIKFRDNSYGRESTNI